MDETPLEPLPLEDILTRFISNETWTRVYATIELRRRLLLVPGMMDDIVRGSSHAICSQCGQGGDDRDISSAIAHIDADGV